MGNRNWMRARESLLDSDLIPATSSGSTRSARQVPRTRAFDEVLELLHMGGRSLPHAVLMMIPEAWENHAEMDAKRRAFYEFHSTLMEPWDGPAAVVFSDGSQIGAVLDRNGLRPSRYWVTDDGLVVLASEVGVLDIDQSRIVRKGRLQPGRMFLPSDGSSSTIRGAPHQRPADREHLLLTAGEVPGDLLAALLEAGEQVHHPLVGHGVDRLVLHGVAAAEQVLIDGQIGEDPPALHHLGDAGAHDVGRLRAVEALAVVGDRALGDRAVVDAEQTGHGPHRGLLPAPLAPSSATIWPSGTSIDSPRSDRITLL